MHDRSGAEYRFNVFSATLGFSRRHLFRRSPTRTRDDLLACMYDTAARLGGVPAEWLTDNMSAIAAVGGDGRRRRDPRVERFAREAGFEIVLCAPRTPETKGKVESANRFLSRLLAYEGDFDGWEGVDAAIARIERRSNEEPNGTTGVPPELLFMREKDALRPLGNRALLESMLGEVSYQTVPATMLVRCAGREFSVPRRMIGRRARLVLSADGVLRGLRRRRPRVRPRHARPGRARGLRPGPLHRGALGQALVRRRRHRGGRPPQPRAARRPGRGRCRVSAPLAEASAPERARNNLEELGMDAMASSAAEYAALVAGGSKTFSQALMEMTDAQVAAVRARDLDRRGREGELPLREDARRLRFLLPALDRPPRRRGARRARVSGAPGERRARRQPRRREDPHSGRARRRGGEGAQAHVLRGLPAPRRRPQAGGRTRGRSSAGCASTRTSRC